MRRLRHSVFLFTSLFGLGLLFLGSAGTVSAHAKVTSATPGIGSTITTAPTTVTVTTAENMKPGAQYSNLFVYGPSGDLVSEGNATVSLNNPKQMSVAMKPEKGDGTYIVRWITVSSDDGDPDQGAFIFTVKAAAAAAPTSNSTATATSMASASSGTSIWVPILSAIVALLVGLGAGIGIGRSRRAVPAVAPATTPVEREQAPTNRS